MADSKRNALVPRPGTEVAGPGRRTPRVIEQMVRDVLARATEQGLSQARFRIGDTALREPDYRQIRHWAEALGEAPEEVLATLAACRVEPDPWEHREAVAFAVEDEAIVSLAWDFNRLPLIPETWETGLRIRTLGLRGEWPEDAPAAWRPSLPQLERLVCMGTQAHEWWLDVDGNCLRWLDLSQVPRLTVLDCGRNQLTALDLAPVPELTLLSCDEHVRVLNAPPGLKIEAVYD